MRTHTHRQTYNFIYIDYFQFVYLLFFIPFTYIQCINYFLLLYSFVVDVFSNDAAAAASIRYSS